MHEETCSNCGKEGGGSGLKKCTGCWAVHYCNRSCQAADWKRHKMFCRAAAAGRKSLPNNRRSYGLLQKWGTQVTVLGILIQDHIERDRLYEISDSMEESVVVFDLRFDYNKLTFFPIKPPSIAPLGGLCFGKDRKEAYRREIQAWRDSSKPRDSSEEAEAIFGVALLLEGTDIGEIMPFRRIFPANVNRNEGLEGSLAYIERIFHLQLPQSPLFATWHQLKGENTEMQVKKLSEHASYEPFLANALHCGTGESLHATHVVQINLEFGFGLLEIKSLESFEVRSVSEVSSWIDRQPEAYKPVLEMQKKYQLDLTGSPKLLDARARRNCPSLGMFTVIYRNSEHGLFTTLSAFLDVDEYGPTSVAACDARARDFFSQLQSAELPPVKSPDLH